MVFETIRKYRGIASLVLTLSTLSFVGYQTYLANANLDRIQKEVLQYAQSSKETSHQEKLKSDDLEARLNNPNDPKFLQQKAAWDKENLEKLRARMKESRAIMFGIDHGEYRGRSQDGEFVASLLPELRRAGYHYIAVECPTSLNQMWKKKDYLKRAATVFSGHWKEFGPVIKTARELGLQIVCYDQEINQNLEDNQREVGCFNYLKKNIWGKNPNAKVITYSGAGHAYSFPREKSFLEPITIKPLGMFLNEYLNGKTARVYLIPNRQTIRWTHFDYSFYLNKDSPVLNAQNKRL